MENYDEILTAENLAHIKTHILFSGLDDNEIITFIKHADPLYFELAGEERMTLEPGTKRRLGVVFTGSVKVFSIDYDGNRTVLNAVQGSGAVGTMQFMMEYYNMLFEIVATENARLMLFTPDSLLIADESVAMIQHKILVNLMASQRQLFVNLSEHLVCLSQKNIRDKILRFLKINSEIARSYEFDIQYSRDELAIYLAVDRASLSRSLSRLKREGVIDFNKNHFKILTTRYFRY